MKGTFFYCRTNQAIKWLEDGDIVQEIETGKYYKLINGKIFSSDDLEQWEETTQPIEVIPPFNEWRSIMNLHYYADIKEDKLLKYMTPDERIVSEDSPEADKTKKRWIASDIF